MAKPGNTKDPLHEAGQKAQDVASSVGQKAQDVASSVGQKAQDVASSLGQKAQDMGTAARDKADDAISSVGSGMSSLAGTIRQSAPREGYLGQATAAVADRLQAGGQYLQSHGVQDLAEDMTNVVRRYPLQSLAVGFGVGLLLGMVLTPRR